MPPEAAAPAAPAAAPSAAPPAATPEIPVSTMPLSSSPPAKPGSARARMNSELRKKGTLGTPQAPEPPETTTATPAAAKPEGTQPEPSGDEPSPPEGTAAPAVDPKTGKPPKVNPWKLVDEYKAKTAKLEAELVEAGKRGIPKDQWDAAQEKMTATEKRAKELEDHIRYVDYTKSQEFQDKYQKPYESQWSRAMKELKDVEIGDDTGTRKMTAQDLLELVQMPLQKARAAAEQLYGPIANDVMGHRNEIRRLFDEQSEALEKAKTEGATRDKETREKFQREREGMTKEITGHWSKVNETVKADPKYGKFFTPVEGDEQGNQRLAKGFELADRAFSENPLAQNLTAEERRSIVERHAAVRNRAAAFGRLVYQNEQLTAEREALKKELAEFKSTVPGTSGSEGAPPEGTEVKGYARLRQGLAKIAK